MAASRGPRHQIGSAAWVGEERSSALQIVQSEIEEFSYSARNELDWLNEHMAGIFDENETNFAEAFKTPGKLRGKTPRTARKGNPTETRVPLSDVFSSTPNGTASQKLKKLQQLQSSQALVRSSPSPVKSPSPLRHQFSPKPQSQAATTQDSGYYGSQDVRAINVYTDADVTATQESEYDRNIRRNSVSQEESPGPSVKDDSPEKTLQPIVGNEMSHTPGNPQLAPEATEEVDLVMASEDGHSEKVSSPIAAVFTSPAKTSSPAAEQQRIDPSGQEAVDSDEASAHSVGSSPVRPVVRKSSLNFASLPAREPLTARKSVGGRTSRVSHLDHNRTSYYSRHTGGKSLGNRAWEDESEEEDEQDADDMEIDEEETTRGRPEIRVDHNRTYTQRLQEQINMLGKSQSNMGRPSKSISNPAAKPQSTIFAPPTPAPKSSSPLKDTTKTTPGAFPTDDDEDEDDWIEPPATVTMATETRPALPKSHTADVMEGIHNLDKVGSPEFTAATQLEPTMRFGREGIASPRPAGGLGHAKSSSVSTLPTMASKFEGDEGHLLYKATTIPHPGMATVNEMEAFSTPSKSPSRSFRDSPLKQVKNKLSSILKSSKNLLASSAAISAEGKSSMLSPSTTKLGYYANQSSASFFSKPLPEAPRTQAAENNDEDASPMRPAGRRTRASVEQDKELKKREKEEQLMADQMDKLAKAREREREKARVFSKEQEKIAGMEKQVVAQKELAKPTLVKETPKPIRSSPRKAKAPEARGTQAVEEDAEMQDAPAMPPPSAARSVAPAQSARKELRRPMKPAKEAQPKAKQAPTVIRVNMGSQYHPASNTVAPPVQESPAAPLPSSQTFPKTKAAKPTLQTKASTQSLRSNPASSTRPKANDAAARKKENEEREAQKRRDAKAEMEKKRRAAAQEEQKKKEQNQRKQEEERLRQEENEHATTQAEAKKTTASRQAAIERAKQTRAPPPAPRAQPNGPTDLASSQGAQPPRPVSRMGPPGGGVRQPEEPARPAGSVVSNATKAGLKRTVAPESNDQREHSRPPSRAGPSYQAKDAKRRRTSEEHHPEHYEAAAQPNVIKGPPVRPSQGLKKDPSGKPMYGYANAPPSVARDLFKATVTAQHQGQKAAHPLDMAQISKGTIPFAPNPNASAASHKTPARAGQYAPAKSAAKSVARPSPRFQNGETIELPEIQTDDEDEDEEDEHIGVATWAGSPDLRRALVRQETMDPSQIFGPPAPLVMEEVFSKSKERWQKFRARTSSANWSGTDRLTEDDIRKDMAARDKMRRDGGWTYEMSKEMY